MKCDRQRYTKRLVEKVCKIPYTRIEQIFVSHFFFRFCSVNMLTAASVGVNVKFLKFKHVSHLALNYSELFWYCNHFQRQTSQIFTFSLSVVAQCFSVTNSHSEIIGLRVNWWFRKDLEHNIIITAIPFFFLTRLSSFRVILYFIVIWLNRLATIKWTHFSLRSLWFFVIVNMI